MYSIIFLLFFSYRIIRLILQTIRLNNFTAKYYTPNRNKFFGTFLEFVNTMRLSCADGSVSEQFVHWRMGKFAEAKQLEKFGQKRSFVFKTLPWRQLLYVADPELIGFLSKIDPQYITKGGFAGEVLLTDPTGFKHGLVMMEHDGWKQQRKVLWQMFQAKDLENFIEDIDQSAISFVNVLEKQKNFQTETSYVSCRNYIYEVLFKCLFGEFNIDLQNQTSEHHQSLISMFQKLGDLINWKVRNMPLTLFVANVPVLGPILAKFYANFRLEQKLVKERDAYTATVIEKARQKIKMGVESKDIATVLVKAQQSPQGKSIKDVNIQGNLIWLKLKNVTFLIPI